MRLSSGLILAVAYLTSGCALTTENITLAYKPQATVTHSLGGKGIKVIVDVYDQRRMKDRVGVKKNGYGMEMAPIVFLLRNGATRKP